MVTAAMNSLAQCDVITDKNKLFCDRNNDWREAQVVRNSYSLIFMQSVIIYYAKI